MRKVIIGCVAGLVLAGCSANGGLMVVDSGPGPDEFSVMPLRPLEMPATLELPQPTPGGANRTDPNPIGDAILALRGNPAAATAGGIPARDAALVAHTSRNGVEPGIRATLAAEDEALRARASTLRGFNPLGNDRYFPTYARWALDAYAELARFRALGVATPTAPPQ